MAVIELAGVAPFNEATAWGDLHDLVVDGYRQTGRWRSWTPDRIDGYLRGRLFDELSGRATGWREEIGLWRTADGRLVAAVHPEDPGEAYLEVATGWEQLEPELLSFAEERWRRRHAHDTNPAAFLTYAEHDDHSRSRLLTTRGYQDLGPREVLRGRRLAGDLRPASLPDDYRIRPADLADAGDRQGLMAITRLVFGVTFDDAAIDLGARMLTHHEYLVAEAPDGSWAAWCGVWSSPEIGVGQFEPVGTHPDHRRRGLAGAVMAAGMRWMVEHGLDTAFVGTGYQSDANRLYEGLGFAPMEILHQWAWRPTEGQWAERYRA